MLPNIRIFRPELAFLNLNIILIRLFIYPTVLLKGCLFIAVGCTATKMLCRFVFFSSLLFGNMGKKVFVVLFPPPRDAN